MERSANCDSRNSLHSMEWVRPDAGPYHDERALQGAPQPQGNPFVGQLQPEAPQQYYNNTMVDTKSSDLTTGEVVVKHLWLCSQRT